MSGKPPLQILLCAPRGFCAGVVRAIDAVEKAKADIIAGTIQVHDYMSDNACPY